jgi:hypothetical protein
VKFTGYFKPGRLVATAACSELKGVVYLFARCSGMSSGADVSQVLVCVIHSGPCWMNGIHRYCNEHGVIMLARWSRWYAVCVRIIGNSDIVLTQLGVKRISTGKN